MNQSNQPLVSVVIPCYNHEKFVQDCIQSVIDQTYQNIELIIIDDGSKDGSVEKIQEMIPACQERFVRFEFRYRPNLGLSATLNEALEWCEGIYFSALASDDILIPEKLEIQVPILELDDACKGVFGNMILINNLGEECGRETKEQKKYFFEDLFKYTEYLPAPTQLLRLKDLKKVNGFNDKFLIEDWYIFLKILEKGGYCIYINQFFTKYRTHEDNFSKKHNLMTIGQLQIADYFKSHPGYYTLLINIYISAILYVLKKYPNLFIQIFIKRILKKVWKF